MGIWVRIASLCGASFFVLSACAKAGGGADDDSLPDGGGPLDTGIGGEGGCADKCNGSCTNVKTDPANCGMCGKACPAGAMCTQGMCQCAAADGGASRTICNGQCVDTKSDVGNCGTCGTACGADAGALQGSGTWTCTNGSCDISCSMPKSPCLPLGCFDLQKDNTHCGSCGTNCSGALCIAGMCCMQGEVDCNGACTNTQTDMNNCGMCGTKCTGSCMNGVCQKKLVGSYNVTP